MKFANPVYLYLIPLLFILCVLAAWVKIYFSPSVNYPLAPKIKVKKRLTDIIVNWAAFALTAAALTLCLIALARPKVMGPGGLPPTEGVDIIITFDTSASMMEDDLHPNRLAAAKEAAAGFIKNRQSDRIGIVSFSAAARLTSPLTLDYAALNDYLNVMDFATDQQGTAVGDAIAVSVKHLLESRAKSKVIILITDGESNVGAVDPLSAAKAAASYGVKIYAIGVSAGARSAGETLKAVAQSTGGQAYMAYNNLELNQIYSQINNLEKTVFEQAGLNAYSDFYRPFLTAAIILLLLAFAIDKFIFIRIP